MMHQLTPAKPVLLDARSAPAALSAQAVFRAMFSQQIYAYQIAPATVYLAVVQQSALAVPPTTLLTQ